MNLNYYFTTFVCSIYFKMGVYIYVITNLSSQEVVKTCHMAMEVKVQISLLRSCDWDQSYSC